MSASSATWQRRFAPAMLDGLDEPVRGYFSHALASGAQLSRGVRLQLVGRVRVGAWLGFDSVWEVDGRPFTWAAKLAVLTLGAITAAGVAPVALRPPGPPA